MSADVHTLAGAYAVDALDRDERAFFERHLALCEECRREVEGFRETAAALGAAVAEPPPPSLRANVLAAVDVTRQVPPVAPPLTRGTPFLRYMQPLLAPVAAVLAIAVVVLGSAVAVLRVKSPGAEIALQGEIAAVLAAPDLTEAPLTGEDGASARFLYAPSLDRGVFVADGLAPLPESQTYELWLFHDGQPMPSELFDASGDGRAIAVVKGQVVGAEVVAVTVEPEGGRPQPTGPVVVAGDLSL